jgi:hypothetical protein
VLGQDDPTTTLRIYGHVVAGAQELVVGIVGDAFKRARALLGPGLGPDATKKTKNAP